MVNAPARREMTNTDRLRGRPNAFSRFLNFCSAANPQERLLVSNRIDSQILPAYYFFCRQCVMAVADRPPRFHCDSREERHATISNHPASADNESSVLRGLRLGDVARCY